MNARIRLYVIASLLACSTIALSAHHTITAFYDPSRHATLNGVVENIEWKNPHSFIHLRVMDVHGSVGVWQIETQAPYVIRQRHLDLLDAIKPGDAISVTVCVSKDGLPQGWLREVVTAAGMTFDLSGAGGC